MMTDIKAETICTLTDDEVRHRLAQVYEYILSKEWGTLSHPDKEATATSDNPARDSEVAANAAANESRGFSYSTTDSSGGSC